MAETEKGQTEPGLLILVTGPTRSGKDMTARKLLAGFPERMKRLVTYTTRPLSPDEVEKQEYHRVSEEEFLAMEEAGLLAEKNKYGQYYYGTGLSSIKEVLMGEGDIIWRVDMSLAARVDELIQEKFDPVTAEALLSRLVVIAIVPKSISELKGRWQSEGRGDAKEFYRRMRQDAKVWRERRDKFPHVVVNPDGVQGQTVEQVVKIVEARREEVKAFES